MSEYQAQRLFDGFVCEAERGAFTAFDIEPEDVDHYRAEEVLVFVVTATVTGGAFAQNNKGVWVRTNKLTTHQVHVAEGSIKDELVDLFNLAGDELPFPGTLGSHGSDEDSEEGDENESSDEFTVQGGIGSEPEEIPDELSEDFELVHTTAQGQAKEDDDDW